MLKRNIYLTDEDRVTRYEVFNFDNIKLTWLSKLSSQNEVQQHNKEQLLGNPGY